jgi:hypothetical protein
MPWGSKLVVTLAPETGKRDRKWRERKRRKN